MVDRLRCPLAIGLVLMAALSVACNTIQAVGVDIEQASELVGDTISEVCLAIDEAIQDAVD